MALGFVFLTLVLSGIDHAPPPDNPAIAPQDRPGSWRELHETFVARAAAGDVDLLFLGDSIIGLWRFTAPTVWERHYVPRKVVNFGIGGDQTQHLLWRLDHGELEGIQPRVVVLMIGTNNLSSATDDQIVDGVKAVVDRVRLNLPTSKILLLGLTPRGVNRDHTQVTTTPDPRVPRINLKIAKLAEEPKITYLDISAALLDSDGRVVQVIEPDFLHLSRKGYQIWADAMEPTLWRLMEVE